MKKLTTEEELKRKKEIEKRRAERYDKNLENTKLINKDLVTRYPFLLPRNYEDQIPDDYDYSYTVLDNMPPGWKNTFAVQMCEDIKNILQQADYLNEYRIGDIKEKFGELRWYHGCSIPTSIANQLDDIISEYSELSTHICYICGDNATHRTKGWISYVCADCAKKHALVCEKLEDNDE